MLRPIVALAFLPAAPGRVVGEQRALASTTPPHACLFPKLRFVLIQIHYASRRAKGNRMATNFGAAEIFGKNILALSSSELRVEAKRSCRTTKCPFSRKYCNKQGGVCSLREFQSADGVVSAVSDLVVATCPERFLEKNEVFAWVGEVLLGTKKPLVLKELPFLRSVLPANDASRGVGKIDMVLVHPETSPLRWCALEMQAVYFSGASMTQELKRLGSWKDDGLPMPEGRRRPDFRSSGPKRLMPQLQIKVPSISRWGKKMAVVVDEAFWSSLTPMTEVDDVSNSDIAWFVVRFKPDGKRLTLTRGRLHLTTLERAVEGLTAGIPTSLSEFEKQLAVKLRKLITENTGRATTTRG